MSGSPLPPFLPVPFLVLFLALLPHDARAQYAEAPAPAAWALENVTVVHADAREEEGMTLIVRNGLIERLSADVEVPQDARRIDWEDGVLRIYPGIVDAHGGAATSFPTPDREGVESWSPTREVQFFTPHRVAADFLTANGAALSAYRRQGVVASVVYPGRGIMPGQPSLLLHAPDARSPRELVLDPSIGVAMAFQGAQGAYPGTLMAQHAFLRQTFHDAAHHRARSEAARGDPRGLPVAAWDADLELVHALSQGDLPVLFLADGAEEIRRVLTLSDELGFLPVIVGGAEAGRVAGDLRDRGIRVLLNARLPVPMDWDPAAGEEDEEPELTPAAFRERQRLEPIFSTPARLAEAGVPFAFTSGGEGAVDLLAGIRRAIEYGLAPEDALRALTTVPADFLGVPHLVRIEEGMPATFLVADRPLFEEGVSITWTFVNGIAEKGADPRLPGAEPDEEGEPGDPEDLVGRWTGSIDVQGQAMPSELVLRMTGGVLAGSMGTEGAPSADIENVTWEDGVLGFSIPVPEMGGARAYFTGTVSGDRMSGTGNIGTPDGAFTFTFEFRRSPGGDDR